MHVILIDPTVGSCGEISDWVDGRPWRLEVDDRVDLLRRWEAGKPVPERQLGSPEYRAKKIFMRDLAYLGWSFRAQTAEKAIDWHRSGRLAAAAASGVAGSAWRFLVHLPLTLLPPGMHRFLTHGPTFRERLERIFVRPFRLYFDAASRERWLRDMVLAGRNARTISGRDADVILTQIDDPYVQKYLKSLAVHVLTLPVTQMVSVTVAWFYVRSHPGMTVAEASAAFAGIVAAFQLIPVSPGSLVRGLYVTYLVVRERNLHEYRIAMALGFFKYIGYLSFPIQMAYRYPTLARFMASRWATEAVHVMPVFGEPGALLEHRVFGLFYNWPLTIRRRVAARSKARRALRPRIWHLPLWTLTMAVLFAIIDQHHLVRSGAAASLRDLIPAIVISSVVLGSGLTLGAGGMALSQRIMLPVYGGLALGMLAAVVWASLSGQAGASLRDVLTMAGWHGFLAAVLGVVGAMGTELLLPEPASGRAPERVRD